MKIISFDVGVKNLAYCITETTSETKYHIYDWNILDLTKNPQENTENDIKNIKCHHTFCKKNPKYVSKNDDIYYCGIHVKKQQYVLPKHQLSGISKCNKDELINHINQLKKNYPFVSLLYSTKLGSEKVSKKKITDFISSLYIKPYKSNKVSCKEISLIEVGKILKIVLREIIDLYHLDINDVVLIENQISPIASRMKTIQGMVTQFFIDHNIPNIHYISSSTKLKVKVNNDLKTSTYKDRKKYGIEILHDYFLENRIYKLRENDNHIDYDYSLWKEHFNKHKKKDDLADSFLQAVYWNENNN